MMAAQMGMSEADFWDITPGYLVTRAYFWNRDREAHDRSSWEQTRWMIRSLGGLQIGKKDRRKWTRATQLPWDVERSTVDIMPDLSTKEWSKILKKLSDAKPPAAPLEN